MLQISCKFLVYIVQGGRNMNYKDFNINLDQYLKDKLYKLQKTFNSEHEISIQMYYQGFNDAISLLTKSFKSK